MPHACIILYSMFALRRHRCAYRMRTTVFCFSKMLFRCPKSRFAKHRFGRFSKHMGHKKKYTHFYIAEIKTHLKPTFLLFKQIIKSTSMNHAKLNLYLIFNYPLTHCALYAREQNTYIFLHSLTSGKHCGLSRAFSARFFPKIRHRK